MSSNEEQTAKMAQGVGLAKTRVYKMTRSDPSKHHKTMLATTLLWPLQVVPVGILLL